jgi:hypothetical protein
VKEQVVCVNFAHTTPHGAIKGKTQEAPKAQCFIGTNTINRSKMKFIMNSEILIYQNSDGNIKIDVRLEEETVWLTQVQLCELFQKRFWNQKHRKPHSSVYDI